MASTSSTNAAARPQLLAIAEALDTAAHAAYKQADEILGRYLKTTGGELFGPAVKRDPALMAILPELRRLAKDALERTRDAASLYGVAHHIDADASDECGPGIAPWWVRQVESRFETIERAAAYARGLDYDTGAPLED